MMKKIILLMLLLPTMVLANTIPTQYKLPEKFQYQTVVMNSNCKITHRSIEKKHPNRYFSIDINYPYMTCKSNKELATQFNLAVHTVVVDQITKFMNQKETPEQMRKHHIQGMQLNEHSNTLNIDYQILSHNDKLISIRFYNSVFMFMSAHPNSFFSSLNFDLKQKGALSVSDFIANSDALTTIADYSSEQLAKQLIGDKSEQALPKNKMKLEIITSGTAPEDKNFNVWNIVPEGVLVSFQPYQVTAYVQGPQYVMIPWKMVPQLKGFK